MDEIDRKALFIGIRSSVLKFLIYGIPIYIVMRPSEPGMLLKFILVGLLIAWITELIFFTVPSMLKYHDLRNKYGSQFLTEMNEKVAEDGLSKMISRHWFLATHKRYTEADKTDTGTKN